MTQDLNRSAFVRGHAVNLALAPLSCALAQASAMGLYAANNEKYPGVLIRNARISDGINGPLWPEHPLIYGQTIRQVSRTAIASPPGYIMIDGNRVTISTEVKSEAEEKNGEKAIHSERYYGSQYRSFTLDQD